MAHVCPECRLACECVSGDVDARNCVCCDEAEDYGDESDPEEFDEDDVDDFL